MKRYYVQPDQFTVHWGFAVRPVAPAPCVFRTGPMNDTGAFQRSWLERKWQFYWADLLSLAKFHVLFQALNSTQRDYIVRAFSGMAASNRAFTNAAGVDKYANHLTGERLTGDDPKIDPLICGFTHIWGDEAVNGRGEKVVAVKSFLASEQPPAVPSLSDPRVMWATVINADGTRQEFPQLGGIPVPYPLISREQYYYPLVELKPDDPPISQEDDMYLYKAVRTAGSMSLRSDHTTSATVLGPLPAGAPAYGNEIWVAAADGSSCKVGDTWLRVLKATGSTITSGWVAVIHLGVKYMELTKLVDVQVDEVKFTRDGDAVAVETKATVFLEGVALPPSVVTEKFNRSA